MELVDYIRVLRKNWVLILCTLAVSVAASYVYVSATPATYTTSAKVFVSTSAASTASELQEGSSFTLQRVRTYADLVTTQAVLRPTIETLGLRDYSVSELRRHVTATAPTNTTVIDITVTDGDPEFATELATTIATELALVVEDLETTDPTAGSPVRLSIVQEAEVPLSASAPRTALYLGLGSFVGLALGVGLAFLRSTLDTRLHNEKDVTRTSDVPILGGIVFDPKAKQRPLVIHEAPQSPRAESFRTLRTNLQFLEVGKPGRAFVVTSAMPSEGKSTTSANLAIALAESGARVLLVEADLRRPKVHAYLGIEGGVGLTDVIIGRISLAEGTQQWGRGNLSVLASGPIPPNPSELLGSSAMEQLIAAMTNQYDVVLFDAPPLLPVTDAAILARLVGGSLVVVAAGRTRSTQLEAAMDALRTVGAPRSGIVITMLPTSGPDSYGYGRYGYAYEEGGQRHHAHEKQGVRHAR